MAFLLRLLFGLILSQIAWADKNLGLPPIAIPADNPQSPEKVELGRLLFNDKRFSADQTISCASCHHPDKVFTDGLALAQGIGGQTGTRNAPTVVNAAFFKTLFLDGRENSLEGQALGPFVNPIEHGLQDHQSIVQTVRNDSQYVKQFEQVFKIAGSDIEISHVVKAIAAFERTLIAGNSPFDQYYFGRDHTRLSESAARGLRVFRRKGNCSNCHEISLNNAFFSDNRFYNIGVGFERLDPVLNRLIQKVKSGETIDDLNLTAEQQSELGRFNVTHIVADMGKFKTPTLRNIILTGPYMHDGSMTSLSEVIEYYDQGGRKNPFLDAAIFPLHLTDQEKVDLEEFLKALTSSEYQK
jgi:cytochrome c peroxidase